MYKNLTGLLHQAPAIAIGKQDRFVVFSDIHLGDGSSNDDFRGNAGIFQTVLSRYYLNRGYTLILNGDIEELQKFRLPVIRRQWEEVYALFDRFYHGQGLHKIVGNHDVALYSSSAHSPYPLCNAITLKHDEDNILFILHGHQASRFLSRFNHISGFLLRYLVQPLRIKNFTAAHDSIKRYNTEKRIYNFSITNKIVSIIGHTHRPLFESLSKIDTLKFRIESLCRKYLDMDDAARQETEEKIKLYKDELYRTYEKKGESGRTSSIYNDHILVPCLFNSGCVIGKRGITAIEIDSKEISLIHWFDNTVSKKYLNANGNASEQLEKTQIFRKVLKKDNLAYIFTRIRLLS